MLIELTGPSASGKSAFARYLIAHDPRYSAVRRSVSQSPRPKSYAYRAFHVARGLKHAPRAFLHFYHFPSLSQDNPRSSHILHAAQVAAEYAFLSSLKKDTTTWLLDQGRLQLGSWLPHEVCEAASTHSQALRNFTAVGQGVLAIAPAPELTMERVAARGDLTRMEQTARQRGFASAYEMTVDEQKQLPEKIALARTLGAEVLTIHIDSSGTPQPNFYPSSSGVESDVSRQLHAMSRYFLQWWEK